MFGDAVPQVTNSSGYLKSARELGGAFGATTATLADALELVL